METKVSLQVTDELWRVANAMRTLEDNCTKEALERLCPLVMQEMTDAANHIANRAFELGREYERRNAT
ncbi:MAG TPA: hypothetical protein V6C65_40985 [Allocoleopsis sp.]